MHFPGLLTNPEDQEMLFGGWFFLRGGFACLFAYLFILYGQVMFFVTPTSEACLVQGLVTVPGL